MANHPNRAKHIRTIREGSPQHLAQLEAINQDLLAALKRIADSSVGIDEKNGCQRAWMECAGIARAAIAKAERR